MSNLTQDEQRTVVNALYTAAEKYRECAKELAAAKGMHPDARASLVAQFNKQVAECSALAEKLED